jgi:hypothetical protein
MPPIGDEGWRNRRSARAPSLGFRGVCRARDPPLLRSWIPWEEPMNWESSPESDYVGQPGWVDTVATRTPGRTGLASMPLLQRLRLHLCLQHLHHHDAILQPLHHQVHHNAILHHMQQTSAIGNLNHMDQQHGSFLLFVG